MTQLTESTLPLMPLRGLLLFPDTTLTFTLGRSSSIHAAEMAAEQGIHCFVLAQKDANVEEVKESNLEQVGTIARITQVIKMGDDTVRITVEGIERAKLVALFDAELFFEAAVITDETWIMDDMEARAYIYALIKAFERYHRVSEQYSPEFSVLLSQEGNLETIIYKIANHINIPLRDKQEILATDDLAERAEMLLQNLEREIEVQHLESEIQTKVREAIEKGQKEYYLREQMRVIREELGDDNSPEAEADELLEKLKTLNITDDEVRNKIEKEIKRYSSLPMGSHEAPAIRGWLDWVFGLPWGVYTQDNLDIKHAREVLNRDHYGLQKVKERVLEHLAVTKLNDNTKGSILCFVGPPGVGKTSVASSIAEAVGRNFVRMSLGGVRDESDIRGHRRTYIGAMPGRIVTAINQAKSMNSLILLDEIDKLGSDHRGDPSSALLEVLDSAQNNNFRDHYLEIPLDLSNVMFIATANTLSTVPLPLLDRMEIVELSSYTEQEKVAIGERYLVPKQLTEHALTKSQLKISTPAMRNIVLGYTREAGVRGLERKIAEICRKTAVQIVENDVKKVSVGVSNLNKYLGIPFSHRDKVRTEGDVGTVNGLAWTSVGGEILVVEALIMKGNGQLQLTGQLGNVMKESAQAAYTYIKANAEKFGIDSDKLKAIDVHIHIPEGAIPKDGPSAGVTMTTAIVSALTGIAVSSDVAMTGEITLRGRVLPIGGLKEKCIAANREGIKQLIIPIDNKPDVEEIPEEVREQLSFTYARTFDDVIKAALVKKPTPLPEKDLLMSNMRSDAAIKASIV